VDQDISKGIKSLIGLVILVGGGIYVCYSPKEVSKYHLGDDEISHYHFLEKSGTPMDVCGQAGLVKDVFLGAEDAENTKEWQTRTDLDCHFAEREDYEQVAKCKEDYYKDRGYCKK